VHIEASLSFSSECILERQTMSESRGPRFRIPVVPDSINGKTVELSQMASSIKNLFTIRRSSPSDVARVIEIWRGSVHATHDFLTAADREEIDAAARAYLTEALLWVVVDRTDRPMAFSAVTGSNMDALFVAAEARGMGLGSMLVRHALSLAPNLTTQVNEQNSQAMRFYLKLGFKPFRRDARDDDGRPYPIVHLVWDDESGAVSE
jgi:putative acetyltransferase